MQMYVSLACCPRYLVIGQPSRAKEPGWPYSGQPPWPEHLHGNGLGAFISFLSTKLDALTLYEDAKAIRLDSGVVHKQ
jgi:hypothetical protein